MLEANWQKNAEGRLEIVWVNRPERVRSDVLHRLEASEPIPSVPTRRSRRAGAQSKEVRAAALRTIFARLRPARSGG